MAASSPGPISGPTGMTIEDFCVRNGYSIERLATELEVSRATIFNWKRHPAGPPRAVLLALRALELDTDSRKTPERDEKLPSKKYKRSGYR